MKHKAKALCVIVMLAILATSTTADAKLFGRRRAARVGGGGGGVQTFPANTPPAPADCINDQCKIPLTTQAVPTIAPLELVIEPAPKIEMSIVVKPVTSIKDMEAEVEEMRAILARSEKTLERLRLELERNAVLEEIQKRADSEIKWQTIEYDIEDLKAEQTQLGGGQPSPED